MSTTSAPCGTLYRGLWLLQNSKGVKEHNTSLVRRKVLQATFNCIHVDTGKVANCRGYQSQTIHLCDLPTYNTCRGCGSLAHITHTVGVSFFSVGDGEWSLFLCYCTWRQPTSSNRESRTQGLCRWFRELHASSAHLLRGGVQNVQLYSAQVVGFLGQDPEPNKL